MRTIILLSIVAFAIATPINEKASQDSVNPSNPDISKLPLKKDDPKVDSVKVEPVKSHDSGVHAHPLHKRESQSPPRVEQPQQPSQTNGAKIQPAAPVDAQKTNGQQQPIYNRPAANPSNQKQQPSALNNQRPSNVNTAQKYQQNGQRQPQPLNNANQKNQQPSSNVNGQKNQQPASNVNGQKNQFNQQPATSNVNNQQKAQPAVNSQLNSQASPAITSQSARVRRETPKAVDPKQPTPSIAATNQQKTPAIAQVNPSKTIQPAQVQKISPKTQHSTSNLQQKPAAAPVNNQQKTPQSAQGPRVTREATELKPVDSKTPSQLASNSQKKAEAPAVPVTQQKPVRITRESPKPVEQKPALTLNAQKPQPIASLSKAPLTPPANSRPVREAPKQSEQAKIVPSGDSTHLKEDSHPSVVAKAGEHSVKSSGSSSSSSEEKVQIKKNPNTQPITYNSDHQSPSFVHPVPVEQILKKPAGSEHQSGTAVFGVTKTENVKIEPSFPTTEHKPVSSNDQKTPAKTY